MKVATIILAAIFAIGGVTAVTAAITGSRTFFSTAGSRAFTGRGHRRAARLLYGIAGALMIAAAAYLVATLKG